MPYKLYIDRWVPITTPEGRTANGPSCLKYVTTSVPWSFSNVWSGITKNISIVIVLVTDEEHSAILADPQIICPPINLSDLRESFSSLPLAWRNAVLNFFDNKRIPRSWIPENHDVPIYLILRYIIRLINTTNDGVVSRIFPEADLDLAVSTLTAQQITEIRTWAAANNFSLQHISPGHTIRELVHAMVIGQKSFSREVVLQWAEPDMTVRKIVI